MQDEQHHLKLQSDEEEILHSPVSKQTTPMKAETQPELKAPGLTRGLKFNKRVMMMASEVQDDCMDSHELLSLRQN